MTFIGRVIAEVDRRLTETRKRSSMVDHVWSAVDRFIEVLGGRLAAAISYYGFFAAFALAVVVYSLAARFPGEPEHAIAGAITTYLNNTLPWVTSVAQEAGGEVTAVGLVVLVLAGVGWVEALRSSQRAVWMLDQHPGNWLILRLVDLGMLVGLGVLLGLSLAMVSVADAVVGWIADPASTGVSRIVSRITGGVLELAVNGVLAAAVLTAVARLHVAMRRLAAPVLVIAVGIALLNGAGRWYIVRVEERPAYQAVATAVGLLVYLYLLNQLILFGAALAATDSSGRMTDLAVRPVWRDHADRDGDRTSPVDNSGEPRAGGLPEQP